MSGFGERLRELRDKAGLTQEELAFAAGFKPSSISNYEKGRRSVSIDGIYELKTALEPHIGDHTFYLVTGMTPEEYFKEGTVDSRYILRTDAIKGVNDLLKKLIKVGAIMISRKTSIHEVIEKSRVCFNGGSIEDKSSKEDDGNKKEAS